LATTPTSYRQEALPTTVLVLVYSPQATCPEAKNTMNDNDDFSKLAQSEKERSIFGELWYFLKENKKWWLAPIIIMLLLLGLLLLLSTTAAAPFIYTLF
jgi:hypothetical protein